MYSSVPGTSNVGLKKSMIYLSYEKMHFSYIKSKILCRWLNILRYHVHSRTFFTPKIHPPLTTRPPPPPLARHQTLPATRPGPPPHTTSPGPPPHPASHSTLPATPPCQPPHPACPLSLGHDSVAIVVTRWCSPCCSAKAVTVYVWVRGHLIIYVPYLISYVPYLIFYIPYLIFYVPCLIFYEPFLIIYAPYLIFYVPSRDPI